MLTFANFGPASHRIEDIYQIGATQDAIGVIPEMAQIFEYELADVPDVDNLGGLIRRVGPAKELQENIGRVQEVLGTDRNAIEIARSLVIRSGLLTPVERYYASAEDVIEDGELIQIAVITGGVRNWMARRAIRLAQLSDKHKIEQVVLLGGARIMKPGEGKDVVEGMKESDYLNEVVRPQLENLGIKAEAVPVKSEIGDEVMAHGAKKIAKIVDLNNSSTQIAVVSNAGAWVQNAGQMGRALQTTTKQGTSNPGYTNLIVVSGGFKLGETGTEPTSTHQNMFTALGTIPRSGQEQVRHAA